MSAGTEWQNLVNDYYAAIYRYSYQFLGTQDEAQDATQQTFLKAFRSFSTLKQQSSEKSWLYSIARNVCIDRKRWWRTWLSASATSSEDRPAPARSPELSVTLKKLIGDLPERQREVFILRHWHDFSTTETAQMLGLDEGTVKSHLKRAIDKLRCSLVEAGVISVDTMTTKGGQQTSQEITD
jgi:RNA polymerase sigma-70 factor (ECF subfamily)